MDCGSGRIGIAPAADVDQVMDLGATWSPDSKRIAFTAKREGDDAAQVYVLSVLNGGEAQRVTSLSTGASARNSHRTPSTSSSPAGCIRARKTTKRTKGRPPSARLENTRVYESFPIRNWDRWIDELETHLFVQPLEMEGSAAKARDLLAGSKLVQEKGYSGAGTSGGDDLQPVWTPDGTAIVFTATTNRNQAAHHDVVTHLYKVGVSGGEPEQITSGQDGYSRPVFRPDGKALYATLDRNNGKVYNVSRLMMLAWPGGKNAVEVSRKLDSSVNSVAFSADSRTVYVSAEQNGLERVFALPASGGKPALAIPKTGVYGAVQAPKRAISSSEHGRAR